MKSRKSASEFSANKPIAATGVSGTPTGYGSSAVLSVLRRRDFRLLFLGGLVSSLGDWFLFIALPFYVYTLTGSALATGGTFIAESLPSILFGSVAGVFVDRWDRRRTMIVADLLRAVLLLGLLVVRSPETVWVVFAVSFTQSTIGQFFGPAKNALIPHVVGEEDLLAANSLSSTGSQLTMLIGPALGGGVLALFGISSSIL
ncbi:MAG TPA: MFS transporter, partial [Chloroflexota bacterium]|nr:MFS transporter [Chloroflexota bacterium]